MLYVKFHYIFEKFYSEIYQSVTMNEKAPLKSVERVMILRIIRIN